MSVRLSKASACKARLLVNIEKMNFKINKKIAFIETNKPLHTLFCFYRMNIYWLNKDLKVIKVLFNVRPFRWYIPTPKETKYVLELPL